MAMYSPAEIEFPPELGVALRNAEQYLLAQRGAHGHWEGELSSSALSTAVTVCAFTALIRDAACDAAQRDLLTDLRQRGRAWLVEHQNADGGWGDTTKSFSNISTTALCWAAFAGRDEAYQTTVEACEAWLRRAVAGSLKLASAPATIVPSQLAKAIRHRYGKDHTFSVPILTTLALTGRLGAEREAWRLTPQLPFELAAFPHAWYARLRLPVVSYALPALIAIGNVRFTRAASWNWPYSVFRRLVRPRALRVLAQIQPSSGGFLEASPLTSFVCLSLIEAGRADHPVVERGIKFLIDSVRPDGSWAIDSNLATWVTTLSLGALLHRDERDESLLAEAARGHVLSWLLEQQYRVEHPYTHAAPGGWAWTDLPGGAPDADDTPGALLALSLLDACGSETLAAARMGVEWLLDLQNSDGGIPTFCRGWGKLPFDRSSADLTAHALRAWLAWQARMPRAAQQRIGAAISRGLAFLAKTQREDGAWAPLWFGNQHAAEEENLVYGTSRVLLALATAEARGALPPGYVQPGQRARDWLLARQHADGGWGGDPQTTSSIEETALALEAICACFAAPSLFSSFDASDARRRCERALGRGLTTLLEHTRLGSEFPPAPIGFYFAKLWYHERLYPVIYTVAALRRAERLARERGSATIESGALS